MRRSTLYSATSWVLSLTAHAAAVLALAQMGPVQAAKGTDAAQSREILLLPPATPAPVSKPVAPPPEPKPVLEPRPVPPPEDPAAILGVDDGDDRSKNWLGANKETPHSGPKADQDQAQFTPAPGVASVGTSAPGAAPQQPTPATPPAPKAPPAAPPVPPAPAVQPESPAAQNQAAPPSARKVVASPEHPEEKDVLQDDQPTPGLHEPAPRQGAEQAPKKNAADESKKIDPSPAGELPSPIPGARPDGSSDSTTPARQAAAPAPAPKPPEHAQIDPSATPNPEGDAKSTIEKKENAPPAPSSDATKPEAPLNETPDKSPEQSRPPDDAARDPFQPAPDELPQPPVPPSEPETAPSVELLPQVPGEQGPEGATSSGDRPGIESDRESDAAAIKVVRADRFGKPLAAKGLNIQTVRPRWTTTTTLTTSPKNPVVRIRFRRDGTVSEAKFIDGNSTGYQDVDDPLLDAIHRWRAKGKQLDDLPPGDRKGVVLVMKIQLR